MLIAAAEGSVLARLLENPFVQEVSAVLILLAAIAVVISRLPKIEVGHSREFLHRRLLNWLPLGLTYAFLYMGRYNLTVSKGALGGLMTNDQFGTIFAIGTFVYGCAFVLNGPLTDRLGGRFAILVSAIGSLVVNALMGLVIVTGYTGNLTLVFSLLYAVNMYFQSFGAVAIVKVNSAWFHVRERGVFGGVFGILISLGVYFAYDGNRLILKSLGKTPPADQTAEAIAAAASQDVAKVAVVFFAPALLLLLFTLINYFVVRDTPGEAGLSDFDTADASSGDDGPRLTVLEVAKKMLANPIILTIGAIEFCSGFLRNAIMQWGVIFGKQTGLAGSGGASGYVFEHWGVMLCVAGILGGVFAGTISDRIFHSRRGPVSAVLYGGMLLGALVLYFGLTTDLVGPLVIFMSLCVIGVHGMLSGTASMDFGGKKNVGVAVGLIDGLVYLGTAFQAILLGKILPNEKLNPELAKDAANWINWPIAMIPLALLGFVLALRVWNAKPKGKGGGGH